MNFNKSKLLPIVFIFLSLIFSSEVYSYNRFEHLTVENGLAHTDAVAIIQDQSGLIWIGTNSGLQSYDGYSLQLYDYYKNSTSKIRKFHNRITTLTSEGDRLWLGTKSGLLCFCLDQHSFKPYTVEGNSIVSNNEIKYVHADKNGLIWIKTENKIYSSTFDVKNQKLILLDSVYSSFPSKKGFEIFSILSTDKYSWFVTERNVLQLQIRNNKIVVVNNYPISKLLPAGQIINSATALKNYIYFRTEQGCIRYQTNPKDGNLSLSSGKYLNFSSIAPYIPANTSGKLVVDKNENLWVITQNGLLEINNAYTKPTSRFHTKIFSDPKSLSTNFLSSLFIDKDNDLWVGTWAGGVNFLSSREPFFKLIKYTPDSKFTIQDQFVKAIESDVDGTLWILTQKGGLNHYDKQTGLLKSYNFSNLALTNRVYKDLIFTPDKSALLIGTMEGLIYFDKKTEKSFLLIGQNGGTLLNRNTHVYSLDTDNFGNVWVGTWDAGLYCIKTINGTFSITNHFTKDSKNAISSNLISHILCDKKKKEVFICTDNGLNRMIQDEKGNVKNIIIYKSDEAKFNTITNDFFSVIDKANDSIYWAGTLGGGLLKLKFKGYSRDYDAISYLKKDGVSSNNVEIVMVDNAGDVWFSGNGISKLDTKTNSISNFDYRDGLQGNSFKIGAGHKDKEGTLYFGGIYGMNYFNPTIIKSNEHKSSLIFTSLHIHSKLIEPGDENEGHVVLKKTLNETEKLKLQYYENDIAISFSALNFWTSSQIKYKYRLVGLTNEWQTISGVQNKVYYSNLDYDNYKFEIQVSSNGGKSWNEEVKTLKIVVLPPWWLSIYAKLIYSALLTFIIVTLFRFYNREMEMKHELELKKLEESKLEENHQLKLQFFMNISHEFKTPLTLILSSIERLGIMLETDDVKKGFFDTISRNANKMLTLITELMDFRKTDIQKDVLHLTYGNICEYIEQIKNEFSTWAAKKNISIGMQSEQINMKFDKEKVAKIVTNLISNALKYSVENSNVQININRGFIKDIQCKYADKHSESNSEPTVECCIISIHDQGIGISRESITQIFDRFFQVESKTSMHLGSGIGLAVAKNMVLSHKGTIIVCSERNVGTEFIVAIPLNLQPENEIAQNESNFDVMQYIEDQHLEYNFDSINYNQLIANTEFSEKPVLLLVEDNVELLLNLKQYFSDEYTVLTAENGRSGLDLCKKHFPDLIVSDVMMPEMNGIELCVAVRENLNIAYTPIVLLTSKSEVEHQLEGYEAGADLYIPKPFSLKLLELNIKRLISNKQKMIEMKNSTNEELSENGVILRNDIRDNKEKIFVDNLMKLINENLDNTDYSVENICKELAVGRTKLYTKVKDITGQALGDLIRDVRLNKSAYLLRHTDLNITEIIYEVGFGSNSHFSKAFKARFGMTPSEYAKSNR